MEYTFSEKAEVRSQAEILLEKMKKEEKKHTFYTKTIGKNTIVCCKNKERLEDYDNNYNNIKNW